MEKLLINRWKRRHYDLRRNHPWNSRSCFILGIKEVILQQDIPAGVLRDQGKYEQAEEMHRQALGLYETMLGKEHPSSLTSMNNLAWVLSRQGKYAEAEEMPWAEANGARQRPSTLRSIYNQSKTILSTFSRTFLFTFCHSTLGV
jgi:tetratricopeptide (TPR) repeat protein